VTALLARTGGHAVYALLAERMAAVSTRSRSSASRRNRFHPAAVADRARVMGRRGHRGRAQLDHEDFVQNLVAMVAAAVAAPLKPLT